MIFREAIISDIPQLMIIRFSVKENILSDPSLVTEKDCEEYLFNRGKGWACEINDVVVGFAIVDLQDHSVWALFIQPGFDGKGIGKKLHDMMLNWYFRRTDQAIWLGTAPNTKAEKFYRKSGWRQTGIRKNGEIKFEMTLKEWKET